MKTNRLARINRLLSVRFNDADSFADFIDLKYKANEREYIRFEKEFREAMRVIHDYCLKVFEEKINSDTVRLWYSRIELLSKNISAIEFNIQNTLLDYKAHSDTPERFFEKEINAEVATTPYNIVYDKYADVLARRIKAYEKYDSYIALSRSIFSEVFNQFQRQFKDYLPDIKNESQTVIEGQNTYKSFNYSKHAGKDKFDRINALSKYLKESGLIGTKTKDLDVIEIFNDAKINRKVNWTGKRNEFAYFIRSLKDNELLSGYDENRIWEKAKSCFLINNASFTIANIKTNLKLKDSSKIDKAIDLLK